MGEEAPIRGHGGKRRSEGLARDRRPEGGGSARADSRSRPGSPRARLFVALDLPEDFRAALAAWRGDALSGRDELRLVAPEALHVTLCFLGWRPEKGIAGIAEAMEAACARLNAPTLAGAALVAVPPRRTRLFALDLHDRDGAAAAVQGSISGALAAIGAYVPEARPFWPHVTLARVKRGARTAAVDAAAPPGQPFAARVVTLYRSTLRPQGALYEPLAQVPLGGPASAPGSAAPPHHSAAGMP